VGSSVAFALSLPASWRDVRGMVAGIFVLSAPIFVVSLVHRDVFDFGKLQGWLWMIFFALFPLAAGATFLTGPGDSDPGDGPRVTAPARVAAGAAAALFLVGAFLFLVDPVGASSWWIFDLPRLGGRVLAGWLLFLSFLAGWAALRGRAHDARLPLVAVGALVAGGAVGILRTWSDLSL
jgi:hypothetical protein